MKKLIILCLFALTFLSVVNAQTERDKKVFMGIKRLSVSVAELTPDAKALGLNGTQIKAYVESSLRNAGFTIDPNAEQDIYVNLKTVRNGSNGYTFAVILYLDQGVILQRDSNSRFLGTTWDISGIYNSTATNLVSDVRIQVLTLIEEFIARHKAVNQFAKTTPTPTIPENTATADPDANNDGFVATKTAPSLPPQIVITNKTKIKVFITVNGKNYVALPRSTKRITTTAGNVRYQARGAGYDAFAARKLFLKNGEAYSLTYTFTK